jgi:hypothetical protein
MSGIIETLIRMMNVLTVPAILIEEQVAVDPGHVPLHRADRKARLGVHGPRLGGGVQGKEVPRLGLFVHGLDLQVRRRPVVRTFRDRAQDVERPGDARRLLADGAVDEVGESGVVNRGLRRGLAARQGEQRADLCPVRILLGAVLERVEYAEDAPHALERRRVSAGAVGAIGTIDLDDDLDD